MTEGIWIALIGALQVVVLGVLGKVATDSSRARKQVENSHIDPNGMPYNLRDNIDANQYAVMAELRGVRRDVGRLDARDIERGREIREMDTRLDEHLEWSREWKTRQEEAGRAAAGRLRDIEETINHTKDTSGSSTLQSASY